MTNPRTPTTQPTTHIERTPDETIVQVWDYTRKQFTPSIRCPGEKRVRVDVYQPLEDLAVYEVKTNPNGSFYPIGLLEDWSISLS